MPEFDREAEEQIRKPARDTIETQPSVDPGGGAPSSLASSLGNRAVQRLLRAEAPEVAADEEHPVVDDVVQESIEGKRGGGRPLDVGAQQALGGALQADFSEVRVHDDAEADELNRAVQADAFTSGTDIFFREGSYAPGTSDGDRLLAHELTHVVQQDGAPAGGEMTVSSPEDASEREADSVANEVVSNAGAGHTALARQEGEEEELMMSAHLDRQEEDEEELMMSPHLDRQEEEEEEEMLQLSRHEPRSGPGAAR